MFRRRNEISKPHHIVREWLWPRMGWRRLVMYIGHRVSRMPDSAVSLAAGFACGAAISFTPFIGFHFLLAALLAWMLNANILASAFGTVVGNPWTFPFIWAWIYGFGRWILGEEADFDVHAILSIQYIFDNFWTVFWPMTLGAIPTAVVAWFASFIPLYTVIEQYQRARRWRIGKKFKQMRERTRGAKLAGRHSRP